MIRDKRLDHITFESSMNYLPSLFLRLTLSSAVLVSTWSVDSIFCLIANL